MTHTVFKFLFNHLINYYLFWNTILANKNENNLTFEKNFGRKHKINYRFFTNCKFFQNWEIMIYSFRHFSYLNEKEGIIKLFNIFFYNFLSSNYDIQYPTTLRDEPRSTRPVPDSGGSFALIILADKISLGYFVHFVTTYCIFSYLE